MFDWEDLRHFAALAEEGSLAAAARRLGVEHATVARRVAALEATTGSRLVDRRSGRYLLTSAGEQVAAHARRIGEEALALERALVGGRDALATAISVSAPPLIAAELIAPRLPVLAARHPELRLRLIGESRAASLVRREADIALRLSRPADPGLMARRIGTVVYGLYAAAGYATARPREDWRLIGFDESLDSAPHQLWAIALVAAGKPLVLRSNDLAVHRSAAAAGLGVAVLPAFAGPGLERLLPAESFPREAWLTYHRDLRDSPAIAAVARFLADCVNPR